MHEQVKNSKNSGLSRLHILKKDQSYKINRLPKFTESEPFVPTGNHRISHKKEFVNKPPEMIPGATLNKDALAETMRNYLLPHPGNQHERPAGVNVDCCCQDYGIGMDKYMDALSYQSSPSESGRHRWDWVEGQLPEIF